jgi:hypothetical protein
MSEFWRDARVLVTGIRGFVLRATIDSYPDGRGL